MASITTTRSPFTRSPWLVTTTLTTTSSTPQSPRSTALSRCRSSRALAVMTKRKSRGRSTLKRERRRRPQTCLRPSCNSLVSVIPPARSVSPPSSTSLPLKSAIRNSRISSVSASSLSPELQLLAPETTTKMVMTMTRTLPPLPVSLATTLQRLSPSHPRSPVRQEDTVLVSRPQLVSSSHPVLSISTEVPLARPPVLTPSCSRRRTKLPRPSHARLCSVVRCPICPTAT
mmetsp:Transcript_2083/g.3671  ORF Transcript_2083/g.3671 Transcript_2083/m.3671 type:complete len:230 (+) Transcript_2083:103-792(+)